MQTCNLTTVNEMHGQLARFNPTLDQGTEADTFQCFAFHALAKDPTTNEEAALYMRDCTFNRTKICEGWLNFLSVIECGTNSSGDFVVAGSGKLCAYGMLIVAGLFAVKLRM